VVRLADWPRAPYLNEEVRGWIGHQLETLGIEEIAMYAIELGKTEDMRRIVVATEVGLLDETYAPTDSTARYRLSGRLYPWQAVRGVDLRFETFRLWALEDRTRWSFRIASPAFQTVTEDRELGVALCDLAKACAVMADPSGSMALAPTIAAPSPPPEPPIEEPPLQPVPMLLEPERELRHVPAPDVEPKADRPRPERPRSIGPFRR
jgi:hypothetical protein